MKSVRESALRRSLFMVGGLVLATALVISAAFVAGRMRKAHAPGTAFVSLMIEGRNAFENADAHKAIAAFEKAVAKEPTQTDAHLNLANAYLFGGESEKAIVEAGEVLRPAKNSAAALYIIGCANLRLGRAEDALKAFQQCYFINPNVAALSFQIGRAHQALGHWEEAASAFGEVFRLEPEHPAAHYALSQVLMRLNKPEDARLELQRHKEIGAARSYVPNDPTYFEKCQYTIARLPEVQAEQPEAQGIKVTFADATDAMLGESASRYSGPIGIVDLTRDARNSIVVCEQGTGVQTLGNHDGKLEPVGPALPGLADATFARCLVGDLNNDGLEDVIMLSDRGAKVYKLGSDGALADVTVTSGLRNMRAKEGLLADLDLTGKLGLIIVGENGITVFRNQGNGVFYDASAGFGLPDPRTKASEILVDDWNGDDLPDLFLMREGGLLELLVNQHGGPLRRAEADVEWLQPTTEIRAGATASSRPAGKAQSTKSWPVGGAFATGDLNCDLRNDLVVATSAGLEIVYGGLPNHAVIQASDMARERLILVDYDNDGWLDIVAAGHGIRIWRNLGPRGFRETTTDLGLDKMEKGNVDSLAAADFDDDGDTDLVISVAGRGLRFLRNDGGNVNRQLKFRLLGKRSNASGLGARVELIAGGWRTTRTVQALPMEIGVGKHARLDSLSVHTTDLVMNLGAIDVDPKTPVYVTELEVPTGSCPYLYVWDGARFRFVTDLLGASPAGLRISEDQFIDADTEEIVRAGDEASVTARDGNYVFQITDELRELLFLDQVQLIAADHPVGTEVHPTSKLRPGKPFPPHQLIGLTSRRPLRHASRSDDADVTTALSETDGVVVSPVKLRAPQLRGLAEPFSVTLDFGPLPAERPLILALTGWLRFGGGMANVAASHDPGLPFPFPTLEVETARGWQAVDVVAGAPAGKTKSILIDLENKLPVGALRLRLTTAFEIHWDRIALFERDDPRTLQTTTVSPITAELHWHGFGEHEDLPWFMPVTPIHDRLRSIAPWLVAPAGWCTRYGDVKELLVKKDDALVILNGGDEVTLKFRAADLPAKAAGAVRDFFLFSSGWDKDADYHVEAGLTVVPLPFHGMNDQLYGREERPVIDGDWWVKKYNTRWVGPLTLSKEQTR